MKSKILAILLVASLSACKTTSPDTGLGYSPQIPELRPELATKAKALPPITDNTMGGSQIQGAQDDMQYNSVAHQLNTVIDIYNCVRTAINNRKDIRECPL